MQSTHSVYFNFLTASQEPVPLHRYWNPHLKDHFYTTHAANVPQVYDHECIACYIYNNPQDGLVPLFCYWSEDAHDHYYTTDDKPTITVGNQIYKKKFTVGYVPSVPSKQAGYNVVPLYQYWSSDNNDHFYTTKKDAPRGYIHQFEVRQVLTEH